MVLLLSDETVANLLLFVKDGVMAMAITIEDHNAQTSSGHNILFGLFSSPSMYRCTTHKSHDLTRSIKESTKPESYAEEIDEALLPITCHQFQLTYYHSCSCYSLPSFSFQSESVTA